MGVIRLTGQLICADKGQAARVAAHLPDHIRLTRAEPGCVSFEVRQCDDPPVWPLVWEVAEVFSGRAAFEAHQARTAASDWGRATKGIERRHVVTED